MTHDFWFAQLLLTFPKVKWCFVHAYLSSGANIISWWPNVKRHNKCFDHGTLEQVASVSRLVTCRCCHTCDLWHSDTPNVQVQYDEGGRFIKVNFFHVFSSDLRHSDTPNVHYDVVANICFAVETMSWCSRLILLTTSTRNTLSPYLIFSVLSRIQINGLALILNSEKTNTTSQKKRRMSFSSLWDCNAINPLPPSLAT